MEYPTRWRRLRPVWNGGLVGMLEFSDVAAHPSGDFLEYTGVEPERLALLREIVAAGGAEALDSQPGSVAAPGKNETFEQRCAERIGAVMSFYRQLAEWANLPADAEALAPVLGMLDRTHADARPYIDRPERRKHRQLGSLHLDLIQLVDAARVIALRLSRHEASPVMPAQRWIAAAPALWTWLEAAAGLPGLLFGAAEAARRLPFFTRSMTTLTVDQMQPLLAVKFEQCGLDARGMYQATMRYNARQAAAGDVQLFTWWPEDPADLREYSARHETQQAAWRSMLAAVQADLAELAVQRWCYAGWINYYNYA